MILLFFERRIETIITEDQNTIGPDDLSDDTELAATQDDDASDTLEEASESDDDAQEVGKADVRKEDKFLMKREM